jgi:hypothetical protein
VSLTGVRPAFCVVRSLCLPANLSQIIRFARKFDWLVMFELSETFLKTKLPQVFFTLRQWKTF